MGKKQTHLQPFFKRIGSKSIICKNLVNMIPPHKTYVELFVGGGALFFALANNNMGTKKIINDLDTILINDYLLLQNADPCIEHYKIPLSLEEKNEFISHPPTNKAEELLQQLFKRNNGFSGTYFKTKLYQNTDHFRKINKIPLYKEKLQHTTILNQDYRDVLNKYDSKDTFFFLDPPYENSKGLYENFEFNFVSLKDLLTNIQGNFLLTLNDSENIRNIFKEFKIQSINVRGAGGAGRQIGGTLRKELIIYNYDLPN